MAFFTFVLISCNANTTTATGTDQTSTTKVTTITTYGGTISESTIFLVEFDSGGSTLVANQTVLKGNTVEEPSISKTGYSLDGWYLSEDNGVTFIKKWNFSTDTVNDDIKLYAIWNINQYTITFITNGGLELEMLTQDYDSEIIIEEPIRTNYQFAGWYLDEELTTPYNFTTMPAYDLVLYASWTAIGDTFELHYYLLPDGSNPLIDEIVTEIPKFVTVSARSYFTLGLTENHEVYAWGCNEYYQLGDGTNINKARPVNITSFFYLDEFDYIVQIEAGYMHSVALTNEGKVYTWGDNEDGELGVGDTEVYTSPIDITDNFGLLENEKIISVDTGNYHSSALSSLGRVFMWGDNSVGQLGTEAYSVTTLPIIITDVFNLNVAEEIIAMALGGNHSLALTTDGRVFSWGFNFTMQLGDGTNVSRTTPLDITANFALGAGEEITQIVAGNNHSGAVTNLGNVFTFGYNVYGQLGNGNNTNQGIPVKITSQFALDVDETITDLFMGVHFSSAVTNKQKIFTWGLNDTSQLGNEAYANSPTPINISSAFDFSNENEIIS
ncbi:MAG: InlB B-repeat-containing protein, partial [Candidatus Izemoplasmatales bacterium]|nr:InlB B-repeat-containing protein [Candidatus Izemoplasmatales bacterium]